MRKILSTTSFFLSLVFLFVLWAAFKPLPESKNAYDPGISCNCGQVASVTSGAGGSSSADTSSGGTAEVKVDAPSISQLRDANPSVTLVADPFDGQVSAITVKEGEFLRVSLSPYEQGDFSWFIDDQAPPTGEYSRFLTSPRADGTGTDFTGWFHGKGTFRKTFKFGVFAISLEDYENGVLRHFVKQYHVDVTVK